MSNKHPLPENYTISVIINWLNCNTFNLLVGILCRTSTISPCARCFYGNNNILYIIYNLSLALWLEEIGISLSRTYSCYYFVLPLAYILELALIIHVFSKIFLLDEPFSNTYILALVLDWILFQQRNIPSGHLKLYSSGEAVFLMIMAGASLLSRCRLIRYNMFLTLQASADELMVEAIPLQILIPRP